MCHKSDNCEFIQINDFMHINRFKFDFALNSLFRRRQKSEKTVRTKKMFIVTNSIQLFIDIIDVMNTMYF